MSVGAGLTVLGFLAAAGLSSSAWVVLFMILHFAGSAPLLSFYDNRVLSAIPVEERSSAWGVLRSYGSVGWGIVAVSSFALKDSVGWVLSCVVLVVGMAVALYGYYVMTPVAPPPPTGMELREVLSYASKNRSVLLFLVTVAVSGFSYSLSASFLPRYLEHDLAASSLLIGLSVTMTVVVEIPLFLLSGHVYQRFTDHEMLSLALLAWALRALGYAILLVYSPWLVLLLEPLHGISFGFMWLGGVRYVRHAFPETLSQSSIGLLSVAAFGVGPTLGNVVGGLLYSAVGARWLYGMASLVVAAVAVGYYWLSQRWEATTEVEAVETL
ncbi:Major Facilitator Superfamily/MFS_1 like family/LacY proton/sugar symporter/Nucleoside H+ symporter, putative [Angomonas deanei]|uniref:Major Facilitator Superfamily/MFS_1 like family/LacY proton/sugar symporter/Nucleoside H+ symporter, putative n=1 Tax=Angomonas deanei TaxID=59799 RepID=A0A7G2CE74_9TRYP|nr:Major Facilitator Superfamily/MFS_1 like family/LacY proton/sugar symporter/Nucleoside H+ symporter, putative [Angomonas deanei]